ncbi:thrombospondin type 3 repeat-containing protein [Patescibacteria group bacterium]|nr:thrombospondin type 3 repeat-containing protein [Patescibacteria group bacterium]
MFNIKNQTTDNIDKEEINPLENTKESVWGQIYTMPVTYQAPLPKDNIFLKYWWLGAIGAVVLAATFGIYFLLRNSQSVAPNNLPVAVNQPIQNISDPSESETLEEPAPATPAERDRLRYKDIRNIQAALEIYKAEQKRYPLAVQPIILGSQPYQVLAAIGFTAVAQPPLYMDKVPTNPEPGGLPYLYESPDGLVYTIKFSLEEGVAGLLTGEQLAGPLGINVQLEETITEVRSVVPPSLTSDQDADGLTDMEEAIFGTDVNKPDSDSDGYLDGSEVNQGYDPIKADGAKLIDSEKFSWYKNEKFNYDILYPLAWLAKATDQETTEVIFSGAEGEFIEVLVVDNPGKLTAVDWYAKQVPNLKPAEVPIVTIGDLTWARSLDGLNLYTTLNNSLVTLSYNIGTRTQASYYHLFQAMVKSFQVVKNVVNLPPGGNNPPAL